MARSGPHSLTENGFQPSKIVTADQEFCVSDGQFLLIGGPELCRKGLFTEWDGVTLISTVEELTTVEAEEPLVLHDFYRLYFETQLEPEEESYRRLVELCQRSGVCLSIGPRSLEWLINHTDITDDIDLLGSYTDCVLTYDMSDPDGFISHLCERYDLDRSQDIRTELPKLGYQYAYTEPYLNERFGTYESYIPALIPVVTDLKDQGGFFPDFPSLAGIRDRSASLSAEIIEEGLVSVAVEGTVGQFIEEITTELPKLTTAVVQHLQDGDVDIGTALDGEFRTITQLGASSLGAIGLSGSAGMAGPFAAVAGFLIWRRFRGDDSRTAVQEYFGTLLTNRLYPHTRAKLETSLGLPPMTLTILGEMLQDGEFERIDAVVAFAGSRTRTEFDEVEAAIADLETEYDEELAALDTQIQTLDDRLSEIEPTAAFISEAVDNAMDDLDAFGEELRSEEADRLDVDTVSLDEVLDQYVGDQPECIVRAIETDGADLLLLKGGYGTGKTTAGYLACNRLSGKYTVRLPNFEGKGVLFSERHLRDRVDATEHTVVYTSYKTGAYPFLDEHELKQLIRWTTEGLCETVIIECRDERLRSLERTATDLLTDEWSRDPPSLSHTWADKGELTFEKLEHRRDIEPIVRWALTVHGPASNSLVNQVIDFAGAADEGGYNVGIAKAAAASVRSAERPLLEYDTVEELVWHDVKSAVGSEATCGPVLAHLCATRTMLTAELEAVVAGYGRGDLGQCIGELRAFLGREVRMHLTETDDDRVRTPAPSDRWRVSPEITADAIFRFNTIVSRDTPVEQITSNIIGAGQDHLLPKLAAHLGSAHESAVSASNHEYREAVRRESTVMLDEVGRQGADAAAFARCFDELVRANIAVSPQPLTERADRLLAGLASIDVGAKYDTQTLLLNHLGWLYVGHGVVDETLDMAGLIRAFDEVFDDSDSAINNAYAMALLEFLKLFAAEDSSVASLAFDQMLLTLEAEFLETHRKINPETDESHELANMYSFALSMTAQRYTASEVETQLDAVFTHLVETVRERDGFDTHYLGKVDGMTLAQFATRFDTPPEVWAKLITRSARNQASALTDEVELPAFDWLADADEDVITGQRIRAFLLSVYIEAFFQLASQRGPEGAEAWCTFLLDEHRAALEALISPEWERNEGVSLALGSESIREHATPYYWLGSVHAPTVSVAAGALMYQPDKIQHPEAWIRHYVRVFDRRGTSLDKFPYAGVVYLGAGLLKELFTDTPPKAFQDHVDPVSPDRERWLPVITESIRESARRLEIDTGTLLLEVYEQLVLMAGLEIATSEDGRPYCQQELQRLADQFPSHSTRFEDLSEQLEILKSE